MSDFEPSGVWRYRCREFGGWSRWLTGTIADVQGKIDARSAYHVQAYELYRPVTQQWLTGPELSESVAERVRKNTR